MSETLAVIGAAFGGVLIGLVVGWPIGVRMRGRPASWLLAIVIAFVGSSIAAFGAMRADRQLLADLWFGIAFGSMTAIKYGGGILPGTGGQPLLKNGKDAEKVESPEGRADCGSAETTDTAEISPS